MAGPRVDGGPIVGIEDNASTGATVTTPAAYAAARVRSLARAQAPLRGRPQDPSGHTRPAEPAALIDLGILDHMTSSRAELVQHTREHTDITSPVPREEAAVYAWYDQHSPRLDEAARRVGDVMVYRQGLEAALLARDAAAIRPERCPSCRCFSLKWVAPLKAAVCLNTKYDSDAAGRPRKFTLAQIAEAAVENFSVRAAT